VPGLWIACLIITLTALLSCAIGIYLRRIWLLRWEERVLRKKYGDLPMFKHFFEK